MNVVNFGGEEAFDDGGTSDGVNDRAVWEPLNDFKTGMPEFANHALLLRERGCVAVVELRGSQKMTCMPGTRPADVGDEPVELCLMVVSKRQRDAYRSVCRSPPSVGVGKRTA